MTRVLFVCTANQCRSPMAEYLCRASLDQAGVSVGVVEVASAGLQAVPGHAMDQHALAALSARGIDAADFGATRVSRPVLERADLIVCMERAQRSALLTRYPAALRRVFTLGELALLVRAVGFGAVGAGAAVPGRPGPTLAQRVGRLAAERNSVGRAPDVADPVGRSREVFERTADELASLIARGVLPLLEDSAHGEEA